MTGGPLCLRADEAGAENAEFQLVAVLVASLSGWLARNAELPWPAVIAIALLAGLACLAVGFGVVGDVWQRLYLKSRTSDLPAYGNIPDWTLYALLRGGVSAEQMRRYQAAGLRSEDVPRVAKTGTTPEQALEWIRQGVAPSDLAAIADSKDPAACIELIQAGAPAFRCPELVSLGVGPHDLERWTAAQFRVDPDVVRGVRGGLTVEAAIDYRTALRHEAQNMAGHDLAVYAEFSRLGFAPQDLRVLGATPTTVLERARRIRRRLGCSAAEACVWTRHGYDTDTEVTKQWLGEVREWKAALGSAACFYALSGMSLDEAKAAHADGQDDAVEMLAALRVP